jgi:hypothetical protein
MRMDIHGRIQYLLYKYDEMNGNNIYGGEQHFIDEYATEAYL